MIPRPWCHPESPEYNDKALERLLAKTSKLDSGCWEYGGHIDQNGYGIIWYVDGAVKAHRLAYLLQVGEIPEGLILDHTCRIRHCVNPAHLEPVTYGENTRRGKNARLDANVVREIRETLTPQVEKYAADYGVTVSSILSVISGRTWKNVMQKKLVA